MTTADINGGTWAGTIDGSWTAAGQTCADLGTVTTADINAGTWQGTIDGGWNASGQTCSDLGAVSTADINAGTVDATIGGTTPAPGTFTTADATTVTIDALLNIDVAWDATGATCTDLGTVTTANIDGGTIDGVVIGGAAAGLITGTTVTAAIAVISGGTVDGITSLNSHDEVRVIMVSVYDEDCTSGLGTQQLGLQAGADVGGGIKGQPAPLTGSIIGITVYTNATCTSGTLTAFATKDGTSIGLTCGLDSVTDTDTSSTFQANDQSGDDVTVGEIIGAEITTSGVWAPITADVVVTIYVEY